MIGSAVKVNTKQTAKPFNLPAPLGGLNGRDPRANQPANDAYMMDNMLPGTASCLSRNGCVKWTSAPLAGPVQSLQTYSSAVMEKMLAFAGGSIYDVTQYGAAPILLKSGQASNAANVTMFSNAADNAQHLIITTGADDPIRFDGTSMTTLAMTGLQPGTTQKTLNQVFSYKGRLYFGQAGKLGFYTLPPGQLQGALSYFDLGQVSSLGGRLVAMASYSDDAGKTPNDYIVFVTSKGEIIVYSGYDPTSTTNWTLVGRYYAAAPIGPNCMVNYGSDIILLTLDGAVTFSEIRQNGSAQSSSVTGDQANAITSKLGSYFSDLTLYANAPGWMGCQYAGSTGWLLLNCPAQAVLGPTNYQFVMNTTTNAWSRITGWNGLCFVVSLGRLFFGRYDGYVMQADVGKLDDGQNIQIDVKQAYNYFDDGGGSGPVQKHYLWGAALLESDGTAPVSLSLNVDFQESTPQNPANIFPAIGGAWDVSPWDTTPWVSGSAPQRVQRAFNKQGVAGSLYFRALLSGQTLTWYSTQVVMEYTGGLLI